MTLPSELRDKRHQPCGFVAHLQGSNCAEWRCPQCSTIFISSGRAYCDTCLESPESKAERVEVLWCRYRAAQEVVKNLAQRLRELGEVVDG